MMLYFTVAVCSANDRTKLNKGLSIKEVKIICEVLVMFTHEDCRRTHQFLQKKASNAALGYSFISWICRLLLFLVIVENLGSQNCHVKL